MPWVTLNEDLENLPGHRDMGDEQPVSPILVEFWELFSGDTVYAKEPELWANRCGASIVWRVDDRRVSNFLFIKGLPIGSSILLCPHQVSGIRYGLGGPVDVLTGQKVRVEKKDDLVEKLRTPKRKFRH